MSTLRARFESKVDRSGGPTACWPFTGGRFPSGYGAINADGAPTRKLRAHRVAWQFENGPIPDGLFVLHKCDNPPCCNPSHLFLGDDDANTADKMRKGRHAHGETAARKLCIDDVLEIRVSAGRVAQKELARRFGVSQVLISRIQLRKTWKSV